MNNNDIAFLVIFGPVIAWWLWVDHKIWRDLKKMSREQEYLRQRIRDREGRQ